MIQSKPPYHHVRLQPRQQLNNKPPEGRFDRALSGWGGRQHSGGLALRTSEQAGWFRQADAGGGAGQWDIWLRVTSCEVKGIFLRYHQTEARDHSTGRKYVSMSSMSRSRHLRFLDVIDDARQHRHVPEMHDDTAHQAQGDKLPGDRVHVSSRSLVVTAARRL